ncbi:MAG: 2Fe-2S iron-sulfur cluster-binding protein [Nitrospirales bacterium]
MPRVTFIHPEGTSGEVPENMTLLEAADALGFSLTHDCGGNASCTTCRVDVAMGEDNLSEIDFEEQDLLDREALTESYHRLGCQARVMGDVIVQVPEEKWGDTKSSDLDATPESST